MSVKSQIEELREKLNRYNHAYYVENNPIVSDYEFDQMLRELQDLELQHPEFADPNSPTARVGSDLTNAFESVDHRFPMLSLSNTYSFEELHEWVEKIVKEVGEVEFACELKFDGTAISLTYEDGRLIRAVTRGDGTRGDNVTENVRTIRTIPLTLSGDDIPQFFEIRGEILMPYASFDRLNAEREANEEPPFANPRNAAAGTLKQQQSKVVAQRGLDCTLYQIAGEKLPFSSHSESLEEAKRWGFKISDKMQVCRTQAEIDSFINYWDTERKRLPFPTDGIVIKVNRLADRKALGTTAKAPKWAVAYKFKAEQALTKLLKVTYQVGRTGAITPVANLEPVLLAGTTVKRATLHNADQIESLDLREGDMVYVEKGGEIIPKITGVELSQRSADSQPLEYITHCPECGAELVRYEGEAKHYCPNQSHCRPQILGRIIHFVGRKAMNIEGLGDKIIEQLFIDGKIVNIDDLYKLDIDSIANTYSNTRLTIKEATKLYNNIRLGKKSNHQVVKQIIASGKNLEDFSIEQLMEIDYKKAIGEKIAEKIITNLQESIQIAFNRVLFALGIRFVGETTAKYLASHFKNIDSILSASKNELMEADEIGDKIADSIIEYFNDECNIEILNNLKSFGLKFEEIIDSPKTKLLKGLTIVISGTFSNFGREELKNIIISNGGKNTSSISAKTSYLLAGDNIGPSKLEKATKLGIPIISEEQFIAMIDNNITINRDSDNNNEYNDVVDDCFQQEFVEYNKDLTKLNFVALDCEWANNTNKDVCEIGIAIVKEGKIIDSKHWLINPETNDYSSLRFTLLTKDMIENAPSFRNIWSEISCIIENKVVICHNAKSADINCLYKTLKKYSIEFIDFTYLCSMNFAYKVSGIGSLEDNCRFFNIEQKEHHRAEDDARCCALVFIECYKHQNQYHSFEDISHVLGKSFKEYAPRRKGDETWRMPNNDIQQRPIIPRIELSNRLNMDKLDYSDNYCKGKYICIAGSFTVPSWALYKEIEKLGGKCMNYVTKNCTSILVYGNETYNITQYTTYKNAIKYGIECISEDEFIKRINEYHPKPIQGTLF